MRTDQSICASLTRIYLMKLSIRWLLSWLTKMQFYLLWTVPSKSSWSSNLVLTLATNNSKLSPNKYSNLNLNLNKHLYPYKSSTHSLLCIIPSTSPSLYNNRRMYLNRCLQQFISRFLRVNKLLNPTLINLFRHKEFIRREKSSTNSNNSSITGVF